MPNSEKTIQAIEARSIPSRRLRIRFSGCEKKFAAKPVKNVSAMTMAKTVQSCSPYIQQTSRGNDMNAASIIRS